MAINVSCYIIIMKHHTIRHHFQSLPSSTIVQKVSYICFRLMLHSLLCSDIFRDYEADYSANLSAEEVELQAEEGGRKRREAEEEEGREKLLLVLGMPPLFIHPRSVLPHP